MLMASTPAMIQNFNGAPNPFFKKTKMDLPHALQHIHTKVPSENWITKIKNTTHQSRQPASWKFGIIKSENPKNQIACTP